MPNIVAHCWYGDVAQTKSNTDNLRKIINKYHGVFLFGCQGPDPFFFYHPLPTGDKEKHKKVRKLGSILHHEHINDTFRILLEMSKESQNEIDIAFVAGFLCHWALDSVAHPYIFYSTDSLTEDILAAHQIFETMIDRGILDVNGLEKTDYQTYKLLKHPDEMYERVSNIYQRIFKEIDGLDVEKEDIISSYKTFYKVQKLFYDPNNRKFKVIGVLEKMVGMDGVGTSMIIPAKYDDELDAMNFKHAEWIHPCDDTVKSTESFEELGSKAASLGIVVLENYEKYLAGEAGVEDILDVIGNRTFETGLQPGVEMKYFKRDLEKNEEGKN